jgi:prevent-host-death family protein
MESVPASQFQKKIGHYQDRALVEPVMVTSNGRERVVLLSADEFKRLKRFDRESLPVSALTDAELAAIATAEVPAEHAHLASEVQAFFVDAAPANVMLSEELSRDRKEEAAQEDRG